MGSSAVYLGGRTAATATTNLVAGETKPEPAASEDTGDVSVGNGDSNGFDAVASHTPQRGKDTTVSVCLMPCTMSAKEHRSLDLVPHVYHT